MLYIEREKKLYIYTVSENTVLENMLSKEKNYIHSIEVLFIESLPLNVG